jgi:hypothetical protein
MSVWLCADQIRISLIELPEGSDELKICKTVLYDLLEADD